MRSKVEGNCSRECNKWPVDIGKQCYVKLLKPISITPTEENYNAAQHVGVEPRTALVWINGGLFEIPIRKFSHLLESGRRVAEGQQSALISPGLHPALDLKGMGSPHKLILH